MVIKYVCSIFVMIVAARRTSWAWSAFEKVLKEECDVGTQDDVDVGDFREALKEG